jgi:uncharacterized membrane protein
MLPKRVKIDIERPLEDVYRYMNDVEREPEWQPNLREAEQLPPGPVAVGSRRRYVSDFMGRTVENSYVVRALEPNRRLVLEATRDSALEATSEVTWEPIAGGTRVTMSVDGRPRGALRLIPRALLERTFERELRATLERLKRVLESDR